ncbi:hypothetical protein vseg_019692 [Gypsophila vaccaria]
MSEEIENTKLETKKEDKDNIREIKIEIGDQEKTSHQRQGKAPELATTTAKPRFEGEQNNEQIEGPNKRYMKRKRGEPTTNK